jgi:inositol oxygenase
MSIWQAMEMLNTLVDESDPDTSVGQIEHLLQTAEAMRRDGKPDWMQVTGLIHDLGKLLCFFGADGQWDVVGDTFVVGCKFSDKIIYPETFKENPDINDPKLQTENGIYEAGCGLDNVLLSWGHDEYLYHVVKTQSTCESTPPTTWDFSDSCSTKGSPINDPISLILPLAPRRSLPTPHGSR